MLVPPPLRPGSTVAICSPSSSIGITTWGKVRLAQRRLESAGLKVSFAPGCEIPDDLASSPAPERAEQLNAAFASPEIDGIIAARGGFNSIDLLSLLDYAVIARNPKPICGFSDITVLTTALHARLGLETYYGPCLVTFGENPDPELTLKAFRDLLMADGAQPVPLPVSKEYGEDDDPWVAPYSLPDPGMRVVREGSATGRLFGGNLARLYLLQGTEYWPDFDDPLVLFIEDDDIEGQWTLHDVLPRLRSLMMQPPLAHLVRGLVVGRFQRSSCVDDEVLVRGPWPSRSSRTSR